MWMADAADIIYNGHGPAGILREGVRQINLCLHFLEDMLYFLYPEENGKV